MAEAELVFKQVGKSEGLNLSLEESSVVACSKEEFGSGYHGVVLLYM